MRTSSTQSHPHGPCRCSGLSLEEFRERYELANRPVIITDVVDKWPAVKKWTRPYLLQAFAGREVGCFSFFYYCFSCVCFFCFCFCCGGLR